MISRTFKVQGRGHVSKDQDVGTDLNIQLLDRKTKIFTGVDRQIDLSKNCEDLGARRGRVGFNGDNCRRPSSFQAPNSASRKPCQSERRVPSVQT